MPALSITSHSEAETRALARRISSSFVNGDVIVLSGPLGAGKTVFVRGLAEGRGISENVVASPSFGFINEYPGESPIYHFDLYRLNRPGELYEIGWDEYLQRDGIVVIEWGERAADLLPRRYYRITFSVVSEEERQIDLLLVEA